jgi:hypothetical protein
MSVTLIVALLALASWIVFTFVYPLGAVGAAVHLLLGLSAALLVRWWALRKT